MPAIQVFVSTFEKKLWRHALFPYTCFCYYRKHPNNDNKICHLSSSAFFQQHYHYWFSLLRCNLDVTKLEFKLLFFNFNQIRYFNHIDANWYPFQSLGMLPFHIMLEGLNIIYYGLISNFLNTTWKLTQFTSFFVFIFIHGFRIWYHIFWYPTLKNSKSTWP